MAGLLVFTVVPFSLSSPLKPTCVLAIMLSSAASFVGIVFI